MADRVNEISCYSTGLLIKYARDHGVGREALYDGVETPAETLENPLEWTDVQTWTRLAANIQKAIGRPGVVEEIGAEATLEGASSFQVLFLRIAPLREIAKRAAEHVRTTINRNLALRLDIIGEGDVEIALRPIVPSRYSREICEYNRGFVLALARIKGYSDATLEETACAAEEGQNECVYRLRWKPLGGPIHRLRQYLHYRFRGQGLLLASMEERFVRLKKQYDAAKRAEHALQRSEARFRAIFENIQDVYYEATQDGRLIEVSPSAEALTGYRSDELFGMFLSDLFADNDERSRFLAELQARGMVADHEIHLRDKQGHTHVCSMAAKFVNDKAGQPYKIAGSIRDISARKRDEEAVRESEQRFRQLAGTIDEVFWLCAPDWSEVFYVSPAFSAVWGLSEETLYQDPDMLLDTVVAEDRPTLVQWREAVRTREGAAHACEYRITRPDGSTRWISSRLYPVTDASGAVYRIAGVSRDVTAARFAAEEKLAMQEQLAQAQKMDAIGQLAGGIAHDFNNQLAGVMGFAELLREELARDDKLATYVDYILLGSRRAAELTAKLLAFARKGKYQSVPVNLHRLVGEVVSLLEHSVDKRIRIVQVLAASPSVTTGDPTQLQNALLNLALNARDAMPDGGELTIATDIAEIDAKFRTSLPLEIAPGRYIRVSVRDTGIGMDEETQKHIFEPFFTTKKEGKGTGMGLASVYGTVKNHRGAIAFRSAPGKGSSFEVYLPLCADDMEPPAATGQQAAVGNARIMVIDDEENFRTVAVATLKSLGYQVVAYGDGTASLAHYRDEWRETGLVILDMIMPEMDGKETFRALKQINPEVKVLLCSGYSLDGRAQEVLDMGARGFVQKPFRKNELAQKVMEALLPPAAAPPHSP